MPKKTLSLNEVRRILGNRVAQHLRHPVIKMPQKPRDYQLETLDRIGKWLRSKKQERTSYVSLATGLGKTMIFSMLISLCKDLRVLIIVPNKTLVVQTVERLQGYTQGLISHVSSLASIKGHDGEILAVRGAHHNVVVTTDESFKLKPAVFGKPNLIIWDECHWAYSEKAQKALNYFPESVVIGFSATPDFLTPEKRRGFHEVALEHGQKLYADPTRIASRYFGTNIATLGPVWGIQNGWLAELAWGQIEFEINLDKVPLIKTAAGLDYKEDDLCAELQQNWGLMVGTICRIYKTGKPLNVVGRRAYAVCPRVNMAEQLARELRKLGVKAVCIHGDTPDEDRNRILAAYDRGEIEFISSVMVLREGWDAPSAEVCWMLRPTRSRVLYVQVMGRVLRLNGNGKVAMVIDPHFSGTRLAPLSTPQLFLPPGRIRSGQVIVGRGDCRVGGIEDDLDSPYFPKGVDPTIVEVKPVETIPYGDEDWKTAGGWAKELDSYSGTLETRLKDKISERRRDPTGRVFPHYHRSLVMNVCADLLVPHGDTNWKPLSSWIQELAISKKALIARLKGHTPERRRDPTGRVSSHYHRPLVMKVCADLLVAKRSNRDWKTVNDWAGELGVVKSKVRDALCYQPSEERRTSRGRLAQHYHRSVVVQACADLRDIKSGDEDWKPVKAWCRELRISRIALLTRLKDQPNEERFSLTGRSRHYKRSVVLEACLDLLKTKDGDTNWKTAGTWAKEFGVSDPTMRGRLKHQPSEQRRDTTGCINPHYHRSVVKTACADLINSRSGDKHWKAVAQWAEELKIAASTIKYKLDGQFSENRRNRRGIVSPHYHRSIVMKACADLIAKNKKKGKRKKR